MCTAFVAKLVLGIVNTLVFLVGLAMFVIGILIHTQPAFSQKALGALLDQLESTANSTGVSIDTSDFDVSDVAYSFTIAIICVGIFLATVSVLGLIGVKYSLKPVLVVYFIITLVLFLVQLAIVLIVYIDRGVFDDNVKPHLKDTITDNFAGLDGEDPATQTWNGIMVYLKCCGVDSYMDFNDIPISQWDRELHGETGFVAPIACCKTTPTGPPYDMSCARTPSPTTSNFETGCYDEIWEYLTSTIVIAIAAVVLCLQLVLLILTCLLMNSMGKVSDVV